MQRRVTRFHGVSRRIDIRAWKIGTVKTVTLAAHDDRVDLESDQHYVRLDCLPSLLCDLYFDAADQWIFDRAYD